MFLTDDFILKNSFAKELYHGYAKKQPIIDYHCHLDPKEIFEDQNFTNLTQAWLAGDHYKWRLMRANGVAESLITGDADDYEKFCAWAQTLEACIGNPLYVWTNLELKRIFGIDERLTLANAASIWEKANQQLQTKEFSPRGLIKKMAVEVICTTDDPVDTLEWHAKIKEDPTFDVQVLPAWRPDKATNVEAAIFPDYIRKLEEASKIEIQSFEALKRAVLKRMEYFDERGCKVSDHGLNYVMYVPAKPEEVEAVFQKGLAGEPLDFEEIAKYKTAFMQFLGKEYHRMGWVMQLHYGCKRDNNRLMFEKLGPDTGYDCINNYAPADQLADFLNSLVSADELPKTILYSLNPNDNAVIGTVLGCFQDSTAAGKLQQGSAWWFNDHKAGMTEQMTSLANLGMLSNFVGMLTDSRSFLSYTRHEYFRRILCELIGGWVENGEYPYDERVLSKMIKGICYKNAVDYFGFAL